MADHLRALRYLASRDADPVLIESRILVLCLAAATQWGCTAGSDAGGDGTGAVSSGAGGSALGGAAGTPGVSAGGTATVAGGAGGTPAGLGGTTGGGGSASAATAGGGASPIGGVAGSGSGGIASAGTGGATAPGGGGSQATGAAGATGGVSSAGDGGKAAEGGASSGGGGQGGASVGGGGQAGATDVAAAASVLDGFQLLDPCDLTSYSVEQSPGAVCPQKDDVKNQHVALTFGGDASLTYDVTLHVRGIFEGYWYADGELDAPSGAFYTGGVPTIGGFGSACKNKTSELPFSLPSDVAPTDDCFNGFNVVAMMVSAPKQHFFLNYTADQDGDRPPHAVYTYDYTVTISIQGQATLDFYIIGSDEHQCYNHDVVLSGVDLPSSPYVGDFFQFDVESVALHP